MRGHFVSPHPSIKASLRVRILRIPYVGGRTPPIISVYTNRTIMGFFDWLGNAVGGVWNGIKNVAGNVYEGAKSAVNWVADKVKPIVETVGKVASYIPVIGAPISGIANQISSGIGMAQKGLDTAGSIGGALNKAFSRK